MPAPGPMPPGGQQEPPRYGQRIEPGQMPPAYGAPPPGYGPGGYAQPGPGMPPPGYGPPGRTPWMVAKPGVIPLQPLRLGDIYSGAMATIRGNPTATIGLSLILALIVAVPTVGTMLVLDHTALGDNDLAQALALLVRGLGELVSSITSIILTGMLIAVLSEAVLGRRMSIGEAWERARRHILSLIGLSLLIGFGMLVVIAVVIALVWALAVNAPAAVTVPVAILLSLAAVCLIVLCYVRFSLAAPAIVLERCRPIHAIKRSWILSSQQFWRLFGISLLTSLIIGFVTGTVSSVVLLPATMTLGPASPAVVPLSTALGLLIGGVVAPFRANVTGLLYLDQRIRKEGLDVSLMAATAPQKHAPR